MKNFIVQTDSGEFILTIKYFSRVNMFRIYLYGNCLPINEDETKLKFYQDHTSPFVNFDKENLKKTAITTVYYHNDVWYNEKEFEKWFNKSWDLFKTWFDKSEGK